MFYPEGEIAICRRCRTDIPVDHYWRGMGTVVSGKKLSDRTLILYNRCPECGVPHSYGLEGNLAYRLLYAWIWSLRYPRRKPRRIATKEQERTYESPLRRAV